MGERKMYNFPFVEDGQTYWRSRSCTTVGYVFCADKEGYLCVLANQRGPGAPTNVGKWNVPCGYIDFAEAGGQTDPAMTLTVLGKAFVKVGFTSIDGNNTNIRISETLDTSDEKWSSSVSVDNSDATTIKECVYDYNSNGPSLVKVL